MKTPCGGRSVAKKERLWIGPALIAAAGAAAYADSFSGAFQFDDIPAILENPTLRHLWPLRGPLLPPPGALTVSGRPVLNLSFALNYAVSGERPWSYHALNLLIHLGAALALFGIVRRTLARASATVFARRGPPPAGDGGPASAGRLDQTPALLALAIALIWAVHPLTTESVTYIVQRAESLMGLFYLLTLYCFIRGIEVDGGAPAFARWASAAEKGARRESLFWFGLSWLACFFGMGAKEVMVSAPALVLLYDRAFVANNWAEPWRVRKAYYLSLAATWIPLIWLVAGTGWDRGHTSGFTAGVSAVRYWLSQGEAAARYIGLAFWPHPLVIDYGPSSAPIGMAGALCALLLATFIGTAIGCLRGRPWAFLAGGCFLILAPTSVIPGILQFVAEHRMYLPLAAFVTAAVLGLHAAASRWIASGRARTAVLASLLIIAVAGLGTATAQRNRIYRSDLALWMDTVAKRPQSALAQANLGRALLSRGRTAEAVPYCLTAVRLDPLKPAPHYNLGLAYEEENRPEDALREFGVAAWINPKMFDAEFREGRLLDRLGRPAEAEPVLRQALAVEPDFAEARASLGVALAAEGRPAEAMDEFRRSLRLQPDQPEVEFNLGIALAGRGRIEEAMLHYAAAVRLRPDYADAQLNLGVALAQSGRFDQALPALRAAVRLRAASPEAHGNLAIVLDQLDRTGAAIAEYRSALRLRPDYPEAHYNLGNALLRARDLPAARAEFNEALRLKPDFGAAREMLDRLAAFSAPDH